MIRSTCCSSSRPNLQAGHTYWWIYDAVFSYDAVGRLPAIAAPTLSVACLREPPDLVRWARDAASLIPAARLEELDAGTEIAFQDPEIAARRIAAFLGES